jgi:hypothetical protein
MINGPYQTGASALDSFRPVLHGTGRRSLAAASEGAAANTGFRRVDVSATGRMTLDEQHGAGPQAARDRVGGLLDGQRQRSNQAPPRADNDQTPARSDDRTPRPDAAPTLPPPRRDSDGDGLPRPVTAGRTALLSGRAGVLAQLFGQDPGRDGSMASQGRAAASPPSSEGLSPLRRGAAIETYQAVSRALEAQDGAGEAQGGARVEIVTGESRELRFGAPVLDAVA